MRRRDSQLPRSVPRTRKASSVYSEQLGEKRQALGRAGEISERYEWTRSIAAHCVIRTTRCLTPTLSPTARPPGRSTPAAPAASAETPPPAAQLPPRRSPREGGLATRGTTPEPSASPGCAAPRSLPRGSPSDRAARRTGPGSHNAQRRAPRSSARRAAAPSGKLEGNPWAGAGAAPVGGPAPRSPCLLRGERNDQAPATLGAAAPHDRPAASSLHAGSEPMHSFAPPSAGLIGAFHPSRLLAHPGAAPAQSPAPQPTTRVPSLSRKNHGSQPRETVSSSDKPTASCTERAAHCVVRSPDAGAFVGADPTRAASGQNRNAMKHGGIERFCPEASSLLLLDTNSS